MKNLLIVFAVLIFCFCVAAFLEFAVNENFGRGFPGGLSLEVAEWMDYDNDDIFGLEVDIFPDRIIVNIPASPVYKQIIEEGHWNLHAFYCDSHRDSPPVVEVARELKNEDLDIDIGRFLPNHPGRITLVKVMRGKKDELPPYPVSAPGETEPYPPPKGLIRVGMLECDLKTLPWRADVIESMPSVVTVDVDTLSDGKRNRNYFPDSGNQDGHDELPHVYTYHSDRPDAPKLLVTVYHGRVTEVTGGAEETSDIPYQLPAPTPPPDEAPPAPERSWAGWLFDLFFTK